jgi:hypothetical protein
VRTGRLGDHSGFTRAGLLARRAQYNKGISSNNGEATVLRIFFIVKRVDERVRLKRRPNVKDRVEMPRRIIVR